MSTNPYDPPSPQRSADTHSSGKQSWRVWLWLRVWAPMTSAALSLVLWVMLVSIASLVDVPFNPMKVWAGTLLASVVLSTVLVTRFWPRPTKAINFAGMYALFAVAYCGLEGDTSGGQDPMQVGIVYGSMLALPCVAWIAARLTTRFHPRVGLSP